MAEQKRQLNAAVDRIFVHFDETLQARDLEIVELQRKLKDRDDLEAENVRLKHKLQQSVNQGGALKSNPLQPALPDGSSESFQVDAAQPEEHASCCKHLRILQGMYDKLLEEANLQANNAESLERALQKAHKQVRGWQNWHFSSDLGPAHGYKELQSSELNEPSGAAGAKSKRRQTPTIMRTKPESNNNHHSEHARKFKPARVSSPALPPNPADISRSRKEPRGLQGAVYERRKSLTNEPQSPSSTELMPTTALSTSRNMNGRVQFDEGKDVGMPLALPLSINTSATPDKVPNPLDATTRGRFAETPINIDSDESPALAFKAPRGQDASFAETVNLSIDPSRLMAKHALSPCINRSKSREALSSEARDIRVTHQVASDPGASSSFDDLIKLHKNKADPTCLKQAKADTRYHKRERDVVSSPFPRKRKSSSKDPTKAIPLICEDGDTVNSNEAKLKRPKLDRKEDMLNRTSEIISRLDELMNGQSPNKPILQSKPLSRERAAASRKDSDKTSVRNDKVRCSSHKAKPLTPLANPPERVLNVPTDDKTPAKLVPKTPRKSTAKLLNPSDRQPQRQRNHRSQTPPDRVASPSDCPPPPSPSDEPLRSRPLNKLNLSDFKINPASNSGYDYAYTDVVRPRAQRNCLPGCTDPDCCGAQFRQFAAELPSASLLPPKSLFASSSPVEEDEDADAKLIADYLGDDSVPRHLSQREKERLLTEAKVKVIAGRYGKMHRQRHEKRKSPPGFWEVEMVGTQEVEQHKEEGRRRVREMLEDRWRDAKRGGGLWMFADE